MVLLLPLSWETKKRMTETSVTGCQNRSVSDQVSQLRLITVYVHTVGMCYVQQGYMAASNLVVLVQERGRKDQNLLTLLGKCKECSELLGLLPIHCDLRRALGWGWGCSMDDFFDVWVQHGRLLRCVFFVS